MNLKKLAALAAAFMISTVFTLSACTKSPEQITDSTPENSPVQPETDTPDTPVAPEVDLPTVFPEVEPEPEPTPQTADYFLVTGESVNIRSGAGSSYSILGVAERSTLYMLIKSESGWYETYYKGKRAYISASYSAVYTMDRSEDSIERVVEEGAKLLGTKYVYGAVRYHNGNGKLLSGFKLTEFDCSSLMQYIFYRGAGVLLDVTTRTQVVQGRSVSALKRGDLMFFTNESRKHLSGVERIGHVALYLGNNYILHTASDYAKIEQITSSRWGYYITARRML